MRACVPVCICGLPICQCIRVRVRVCVVFAVVETFGAEPRQSVADVDMKAAAPNSPQKLPPQRGIKKHHDPGIFKRVWKISRTAHGASSFNETCAKNTGNRRIIHFKRRRHRTQSYPQPQPPRHEQSDTGVLHNTSHDHSFTRWSNDFPTCSHRSRQRRDNVGLITRVPDSGAKVKIICCFCGKTKKHE